jgi:histidine triad (HIT) family protein
VPYRFPPKDECDLCNSATADAVGALLVIAEEGGCLAAVPPRMRSRGSVVVLPRRHVPTLVDLDEVEAVALFQLTKVAARAVERALDPDGLHVWTDTGTVADQPEYHMRVEIVPRFTDVPYRFSSGQQLSVAEPGVRQAFAERLARFL